MLHALHLEFVHPVTAKSLHFTAPPAEDMQAVIDQLEKA
jgi:hypothetical protein